MSATPDSTSHACSMCGGQLDSNPDGCPKCGEPIAKSGRPSAWCKEADEDDWEFPRARRRDYVITAIVGLAAIALTLPVSLAATRMALLRGNLAGSSSDQILALVLWNLWIWGPPVVYSALQYRAAVRAGVHHHSHLIRTFGRVLGLSAGVPAAVLTACAALFFAICGRFLP